MTNPDREEALKEAKRVIDENKLKSYMQKKN